MAENSGIWNRPLDIQSIDPNEKLFLFGYSCKIFRDDEKAKFIDQGKHLIPWMGDDTLKIDRYDVRGYLHDLKQYEPKPGGYPEDLDSEEEKLCEEERYRSLRTDVSEEQLYQEEELKRLRAAIASDGAYHEIGFSYDNVVENYEPVGPKVEEPEDEPFEAPEGLVIPKGIETPSTMKIHAIIEKTSLFVSEQGGQMEIIIKMKQHANPQFAFMHLDNPLHPYYKHLVKEIKSGSYKPIQIKRVSRSEDEDEDGHYLHPSLLAGKKENVPQFTVPSINFRRSQDDSYAILVRNLQQQLAEEKALRDQAKEDDLNVSEDQHLVNYSLNDTFGSDSLNNSGNASFVIPPLDMQPIIQKMAEYVAKNGEDFEYVVMSKNDKRFEFLQPSCSFYGYYKHLRDSAKLRFATPISPQNSEKNFQEQSSSYPSEAQNEDMQSTTVEFQDQNLVVQETPTENTMDEFDALYTQDSQEFVFAPVPGITIEEQPNSLDSEDSVGISNNTKAKSAKVLKGPISFSLKAKEAEATPPEKTKIPLLLDDSDEESSEETKEKSESHRKIKSIEETRPVPSSRHSSEEREEKAKLNIEHEAKLAEELKKNKLLSAARERLVQHKKEKRLQMEQQKREEQMKKDKVLQIEHQRKEKELQLERKRKAALFLKMLKKRDPEQAETIAEKFGNDKKFKSGKSRELWKKAKAEGILTENGILFPASKLHMKTNGQSSSSVSEESGEEIMITEFCSNPDLQVPELEPVPEKVSKPIKQERKKKKKKRSRSRSRERRSKPSKSKDRHRSRSPRNHKHEKSRKEKELPAAYALKRSRSRSRSPRRYRQNPYWNRRR